MLLEAAVVVVILGNFWVRGDEVGRMGTEGDSEATTKVSLAFAFV